MTNKSIVGPKGQITIPKELREKYHLHEGEEVVLVGEEEGVMVKHPPSSLRGRLRGRIELAGIEEDVKKLRLKWRL
jgi:AbrB family looped-hinge helix DNA binding protein